MIDNVNNISFGAKVTLTKDPKKICPQSVRERLTPHVLSSIEAETKEYPGYMKLAEADSDFLVAKYNGANFYFPQVGFQQYSDETIIDAFVKIIKYLKTRAKFNKIKKPTEQDYKNQDKNLNEIITDNTLLLYPCKIEGDLIHARDIERRSLFKDEFHRRYYEIAMEIFG